MKSSKWMFLLLGLAALGTRAQGFPVEVIEQFDEARVVAFIEERDIDSSPGWEPLSGPPPLTVVQALEAVREARQKRKETAGTLPIVEIELRRLKKREDRWHYLLKASDGEHTRYYVVLMNGKVLDAIREPEAYK